ncbi:MAG: PKD domain-containing protein [Bacteroidia bacterium]
MPATDLAEGAYEFVGGTGAQADPKAFRFRPISKGIHPIRHEWEIEGQIIEGHDAIFHRFEKTGHEPVILRTTDAGGCINETEFRVPAGLGFCGDPFRFEYEKKGRGTVRFNAPISFDSADIQSITWNMGDGRFIAADLHPEYTYPRPGIYPVKVIILDKNGCLHCDFQNVYSEQGKSCESSILALPVAPDGEVGKVTVQWWDMEGREFNSDHLNPQPTTSLFEILQAEPWEADPDGTPTWRIEARLRCRLYAADGSDQSIELESTKLVFAVGVD